MAKVTAIQKAASINPLKSSQPLGAAFAFLGVEGAMPLFHGSQGCTSFALVLFVRHFKEAIPLQTTALDEVATILGGADHLEEALLNLKARANPKLIGVCTTALVETRGEDFAGDLAAIKQRRASELAGTEIVLAACRTRRASNLQLIEFVELFLLTEKSQVQQNQWVTV